MKVAVCPGSFDPVTYGHLDIIKRTADLFDLVWVAVLHNPAKRPLFSEAERVQMLQQATHQLPNVRCEAFSGLLIEYAKSRDAVAIVRGLRAVSDFEFEFKVASANRHLYPGIEALFMMTNGEFSFLSSSIVREVASLGGDVSEWVPEPVACALREKFFGRKEPHS